MSARHADDLPIAIIGGGLAGLAAALALAERGLPVTLLEARRQLGGRAASFRDPASGELVDYCQHVSMGCCTNLRDFCRRAGINGLLRRERVLHFMSPEGRRYDFQAVPLLPAPLHLAPGLWGLKFLSWAERLSIGRAMLRLARLRIDDDRQTVADWLRQQGQTDRAIEQFWSVVLVSALGETLDRAALPMARKVFVDGFLTTRQAYEVEIPRCPLGALYGQRLLSSLEQRGVQVRLGESVGGLITDRRRVTAVTLAHGERLPCAAAIVAVAWRRVAELLPDWLDAESHLGSRAAQIEASPITGIHLWFDRAITELPHAVMVGTLSQWLFNRNSDEPPSAEGEFYYQVVVSASRDLSTRPRDAVVGQVVAELARIWPAARDARLLRWKMVTEQAAVFSTRPGLEALRPSATTPADNLFLAGDWTRTGWPATMEGAVRSGYLAAEALLAQRGRPERVLVADLPRSWLSRWLLRSAG